MDLAFGSLENINGYLHTTGLSVILNMFEVSPWSCQRRPNKLTSVADQFAREEIGT